MKSNTKILARFANKVRMFRNSIGFSQEALADKAGLHRTYIGMIEPFRISKILIFNNIINVS